MGLAISSKSDMWYRGAEDGEQDAILCCFGGPKSTPPYFETSEQACDYWDGYDVGYSSVD